SARFSRPGSSRCRAAPRWAHSPTLCYNPAHRPLSDAPQPSPIVISQRRAIMSVLPQIRRQTVRPLCVALSIVSCGSIATAAELADLVLHHGKIVTVDETFTIAEAVAIKGDRLLAVGTNSEILKLAGPKTERIDLDGKTVLPGLADSHV